MIYKGLGIVQQFVRYEVWDLKDDGTTDYPITDYDSEFDGFQVWDLENDYQSEDVDGTYDTLAEAKAAIDKFRPVYRQKVEVK